MKDYSTHLRTPTILITAGLYFFHFEYSALAQLTKDVSIPPKVYKSVYPIYPREHLLSGKGGAVKVEIKIDKKGSVIGGAIKESSDPLFKQSVMQAIQVWEFNPCIREGEPVPSKVVQTFSFQANRNSFFSMESIQADLNSPHPYPIKTERPTYPDSLKEKKVQGFADIIITVNAEGIVTEAKLEKATEILFGEYALAAAKKWRFKSRSESDPKNWRLTFVFRP